MEILNYINGEWADEAGLKPPAQRMEALRANERVRFSGLPRTEAGLQPATETERKTIDGWQVKRLPGACRRV